MRKITSKLALITALTVAMTGCSTAGKSDTNGANNDKKLTFKEGTYTGKGTGRNGEVEVTVEFTNDAIKAITVGEHKETPGISDAAINDLPGTIVTKQSLAVDTIAGATISSEAILTAVEDCVNQAGGDVEALKQAVATEDNGEVVEMDCNIVVVGAGAAGSAAAVAASEKTDNVILLEKTASPMGAGTLAGGMFAADSTLQKEANETVSKEWLYDEYMTSSSGYMNSVLVRTIIDEAGKTVDFLMDNGVNFALAESGTGAAYVHQGMPTTLHGYQEGGTVAITSLIKKFEENGGQVMFSTPATDIFTNDAGEVVGVMAKKADGTVLKINAKNVILATGGYGGNTEMLEKYLGADYAEGEIASNTGDGIQMAWKAGAKEIGTTTMHYFWETFTKDETGKLVEALGDDYFALTDFTYYPHLRVNTLGQRFSNENLVTDFAIHGAEIASQPNMTEYVILDDVTLKQIAEKGYVSIEDHYGKWENNRNFYMEFNENNDTDELREKEVTPTDYTPFLEKALGTGVVFKGNSIEELADNMGVDKENLEASVAQYNKAVETGKDSQYFAKLSHMPTLSGKTYYAVKFVARNLSTLGGVGINENIQAIDNDGKAIKGLYVCGADAGGMYGKAYVDFEGGTLGFAYTSGRLAGVNAAAEIAGK